MQLPNKIGCRGRAKKLDGALDTGNTIKVKKKEKIEKYPTLLSVLGLSRARGHCCKWPEWLPSDELLTAGDFESAHVPPRLVFAPF